MKTLLILLISSIVSLASVGKITSVKGEVYIDRENKQISARVGSVLEVKDQIITKDNSKAILLFNDNMSITVGKKSTLKVQKYVFDKNVVANNKATLGFGKGVFRTITGKLGKLNPRGFMIKTATATIGIRGSDGVTRVYADGTVTHTTYSGGFVLTDNATGRTVWVPKGTTGKVDKDGIGVLLVTKQEKDEDDKLLEGDANNPQDDEDNDNDDEGDTEGDVDDANEASNDASDEIDSFNVEELTQAELDEYITNDGFTLSNDYLTPSATVNSYSNTASYSGNVKGTNTNTDSSTIVTQDNGTITLDMDFGANTFDGEILDLTVGTVTISSATITDNTFEAQNTNISFSYKSGTSNNVEGEFYGDNAKVVGGSIYLKQSNSSMNNNTFEGSFGAIKDDGATSPH